MLDGGAYCTMPKKKNTQFWCWSSNFTIFFEVRRFFALTFILFGRDNRCRLKRHARLNARLLRRAIRLQHSSPIEYGVSNAQLGDGEGLVFGNESKCGFKVLRVAEFDGNVLSAGIPFAIDREDDRLRQLFFSCDRGGWRDRPTGSPSIFEIRSRVFKPAAAAGDPFLNGGDFAHHHHHAERFHRLCRDGDGVRRCLVSFFVAFLNGQIQGNVGMLSPERESTVRNCRSSRR